MRLFRSLQNRGQPLRVGPDFASVKTNLIKMA